MKTLIAMLCLLALTACATAPTPTEVQMIQDACNADAAARPTVTALQPLFTPAENLALTAARNVIDPICANPAGSVGQNAQAILAKEGGIIGGLIATAQQRQPAAPAK